MASETLHEDSEHLGPRIVDQHRAIVSLMEELEAVDWYNQRAKATSDMALRAILEHNRDEEKEHAAMVLEWLRRGDPQLDQHLRTYLFTERPLTDIEKVAEDSPDGGGTGESAAGSDGSLAIGSLRQVKI